MLCIRRERVALVNLERLVAADTFIFPEPNVWGIS
jgi:hypothetical protein